MQADEATQQPGEGHWLQQECCGQTWNEMRWTRIYQFNRLLQSLAVATGASELLLFDSWQSQETDEYCWHRRALPEQSAKPDRHQTLRGNSHSVASLWDLA